jgi:hypothetical protein
VAAAVVVRRRDDPVAAEHDELGAYGLCRVSAVMTSSGAPNPVCRPLRHRTLVPAPGLLDVVAWR